MDVVLLSRIQFALTVMFHYLFPPLTIGMGVVLVYLEGRYLKTREPIYETAARFWTKIFALNFAVGVATGIVMEFEFGTNWAVYSRFVGDVFGSALAAEGIFAFFLESGFLAVLVFGWDRVGPRMHFFSTLMVSLGSIFSSIWIVVANSWQQTPAGSHLVAVARGGADHLRAEITSFWELVFNPSTIQRLAHVWLGAFVMGAFFIMSISAWYMLKRRHEAFARRSFTGALLLGTISSLALLVSGHQQGRAVYHHQPAKLAAFEAHFTTGRGDLSVFGLPDPQAHVIRGNVAIPGGLSFLLYDNFSTPVIGLDRIRPEDRPPVLVPFFSYRVMVGLGVGFIVLTLLAAVLYRRGRLFETRWLLWIFVFAVVGAVIANEAGWTAAEVGRQPWVVQPPVVRGADGEPVLDAEGYVRYQTATVTMRDGSTRDVIAGLRTAEGVSKTVTGGEVLTSIILFGLIYLLLGTLWVYVLHHKIIAGPEPPHEHGADHLAEAAGAVIGHRASMTGLQAEEES